MRDMGVSRVDGFENRRWAKSCRRRVSDGAKRAHHISFRLQYVPDADAAHETPARAQTQKPAALSATGFAESQRSVIANVDDSSQAQEIFSGTRFPF
jgi:hypothetical protein